MALRIVAARSSFREYGRRTRSADCAHSSHAMPTERMARDTGTRPQAIASTPPCHTAGAPSKAALIASRGRKTKPSPRISVDNLLDVASAQPQGLTGLVKHFKFTLRYVAVRLRHHGKALNYRHLTFDRQ